MPPAIQGASQERSVKGEFTCKFNPNPGSWLITHSSKMCFSDWPAQSLDLNPIENLWHIIKRQVAKRPVARSVVELKQQIQEEWSAIPQDTIQTLVDSMPNRIAEVISACGGHTHY